MPLIDYSFTESINAISLSGTFFQMAHSSMLIAFSLDFGHFRFYSSSYSHGF